MNAKRAGIVHSGSIVRTEHGIGEEIDYVSLACEKAEFFVFMYGVLSPVPLFRLGVEVHDTEADVDCMACIATGWTA